MTTKPRAYSLPLVLMVLSTLGLALTLVVFVLGASSKATGAMLGRRATLFACDGIVRGLMVASRSYFAKTPTPTADGLQVHLCGAGAGCPSVAGWFDGYVIEGVTASTGSVDRVEEVPTGPFRGSIARRTDITLDVIAQKAATGQRCHVAQSAVNSQIGLFQFAVFSSMAIELFDAPTMDIRGRVHVNGEFFAGSSSPVTIEKVTASGRIRATTAGYSIRDAATGAPVAITKSNDGLSNGWRTASENAWHGNAQDKDWGVPELRLPAASSAPVQGGRDADGDVKPNTGMLRVLIDPPRSSDAAAVTAERLAHKAAIRIINGVWYKKNGAAWPGTPIWSDHPAAYSPADSVEVDLVGAAAVAAAPSSSSGPKRYSYYETDSATGKVTNDAKPSVVSWGALAHNGTDWAPGFFNGTGIVVATTDAERVRGTRTGFIDGRVQKNGGTAVASRGRILPLNFDVAAFVAALDDTTAGELGSHFPTGLGEDAIVWIANTWPGWLAGFPDGAASAPPVESNNEVAGLPLPLCGGASAGFGAGGNANNEIATGVARVACAASGLRGATAVRVWNAETIDPAVLPRGLTIVTNGPMYVLGDANTASLVAGVPGTPRADSATGPWVPLWVGGDAVTLLSNAWRDQNKRWALGTLGNYGGGCSADATSTRWVIAMTGGHVERDTNESGGINNFPRFLECWRGQVAEIHGSLVAGYRSVYQDQRFACCDYYAAPNRTWKFDPNLAKPANQPPGTPSFFVQAVERWQRD